MRRCSDAECRDARELWVKETLLPQLRIDFAKMLIATVLTLWAVFFYINRNAITEHQLEAMKLFITAPQHSADVQRIESRLDSLERSMREVGDKLDRNLLAITESVKKQR
jgi:hypothetical protein